MKYIVQIRIGGEDKKTPEIKWEPKEVEAVDKWDALVKVVEEIGIGAEVTMSYLWRKASIVKKERSEMRRWRKKRFV